jgi:enterochelin esterase-like enzyme
VQKGGWTNLGRAPEILDNLIARGKASPMIVTAGSDGRRYRGIGA